MYKYIIIIISHRLLKVYCPRTSKYQRKSQKHGKSNLHFLDVKVLRDDRFCFTFDKFIGEVFGLASSSVTSSSIRWPRWRPPSSHGWLWGGSSLRESIVLGLFCYLRTFCLVLGLSCVREIGDRVILCLGLRTDNSPSFNINSWVQTNSIIRLLDRCS